MSLEVPSFVIKWIVSFLSGRTQTTKIASALSSHRCINRSLVQGSGIGPVLFLMFARDLKALDVLNYILKYADDCNLIVPEAATTSAEVEMQKCVKLCG